MSIKAQTLVEERSRAKGSNLGILRAIADYAKDNGRHAFPSVSTLAWKMRLTGRAAELIVRKLVQDGEIAPEWDASNRRLHLNIRCICDWEAYQAEGPIPEREKFSRNVSEKFAKSLIETAAVRSGKMSRNDSFSEKRPVENSRSADDDGTSASQPLLTVKDPCTDPGTEPPTRPALRDDLTSGRFASAVLACGHASDPVVQFALQWNALTTEPIKPCLSLTPKRRRLIRAALVARPLDAWRPIVERMNRSSYCRGAKGWIASFDWLISGPDPAAKLLEGQFDNVERPPTPKELEEVDGILRRMLGCFHRPRCANREACVALIVRTLRGAAA